MESHSIVILAAGIGERLDIFETSKPLVKLRGIALIMRAIQLTKDAGFKNIYIVARSEDRLIRKELIDFAPDVRFIDQIFPKRGMLGSILSIGDAFERGFFVMACDLLFEKNPFPLFVSPEKFLNSVNVLISTNEQNNIHSGAQEPILYKDGRLFYPLNTKESNGFEIGLYYFTPEFFSEFVTEAKAAPEVNKLHAIFNKFPERIKPVLMNNKWFDINTPLTLVRAELFLKEQSASENTNKTIKAKYEMAAVTATYNREKPIIFDVHVVSGIISQIGEYEIIPHEHFYSPHYLIVDKNIDGLYGEPVYRQLRDLGYQIRKITMEPGESSKSLDMFSRVSEKILAEGIEKKTIILSIGGGVIKDLSGFLASTLYRGIGFIPFPTTLLSQCDAAIALKQGINGPQGKNLIGSYYSPLKVVVDPNVLLTLQDRYIYDGIAECLKQAFAQDHSFYDFFDNYEGEIKDIEFLREVVTRSVCLKVDSMQQDLYEEHVSLVNQYGHEIGHAVEYLSGYRLLHGESVAIGMRVSAELSKIIGLCEKDVVHDHIRMLKKYQLPTNVPRYINAEDILNILRYNKKYHGGKARLVLIDHIGNLWHDGAYYAVLCNNNVLKEAIRKSYDEH